MSKEEVIDYVMTTPGNPNRAVLTGMLDGVDGLKIHICTSEEYDATSKTPTIEKPNTSLIYLVPTSEESGDLFDEFIWTGEAWERFGAGSVNIQNPDWNESDPTSAAYIKNRPFYIEDAVLYDGDVSFTNFTGTNYYHHFDERLSTPIPLDAYVILNIDGIEIEGKLLSNSGTYYIGAANPGDKTGIEANNIGISFMQSSASELGQLGYGMINSNIRQAGTYHVKITAKGYKTQKLDPKFYDIGLNLANGSGGSSLKQICATDASGQYSFAEGEATTASGNSSHAEGSGTQATGDASHAEGFGAIASGEAAHAEGTSAKAYGNYSHAEGASITGIKDKTGYGQCAHAEGGQSTASGSNSHAEGGNTTASGSSSHAEGDYTTASGIHSHAEGSWSKASADSAHAEGYSTTASKACSHAEGSSTKAYADDSHAEGLSTQTDGIAAHAEGNSTTAYGEASHAEGRSTRASGSNSHAEGQGTTASGSISHAEGQGTTASGRNSHAEGQTATASGSNSHAEGQTATASGSNSHAEGTVTIANSINQHVFGAYNIEDTPDETTGVGTYVEIVGNGYYDSENKQNVKSNARTLDWSGNESLAGSLTLGMGTEDEVTVTAAQLKALIALLNA